MFTCPDTRRLDAPILVLPTLLQKTVSSYQTVGKVQLGPRPRSPSSAPEMKGIDYRSGYQTFIHRWPLAGPTTAAEPGIRAPERPKRRQGNLTPPNKIKALASSLFGTGTRDLGNTVSANSLGYGNLILDAANRLYETVWERVGRAGAEFQYCSMRPSLLI